MNAQEIQQLKALVVATSLYYGQTIPDQVLAMYIEDLSDLEFADVTRALKEVRRDPKTTRFPLPALIRDRITPAETSEADARNAAARIVAAIAACGWNNSSRAKLMIGELGWYVVQMAGGWLTVCETLTHDNVGQMQAQWRELALSSIRRAKAGTLHLAPTLPTREKEPQGKLVAFGDILKQIPDQTGDKDA